jgi:2-keto-3-deoxy-L-rhamnonate aldolase RhmA
MVIVIIEEARAVDRIEEIASVPSIDVMFIGVNDLSYSLGLSGRMDDPKHQEAVRKIVAAAKRHNIAVGRPASTPEQIKRYMDEGFLFFQGPADLGLMSAGARPLLQPLGKSGIDPRKQPLY